MDELQVILSLHVKVKQQLRYSHLTNLWVFPDC